MSEQLLPGRALRACLIVSCAFLVLATSASAQTIGFRDQSVTGTGTQVTGAKPESKLWFNDGQWWATMWDEVEGNNYVFRLDPVTQLWTNTGTQIDNRSGTRADTLWDGTKLYVASHGYTNTSQQTASGARLYRFSYNTSIDRYTLDTGFPVTINNWKTESLVIAKDSTGRIWATWNQGTQIFVTRTLTSDSTWGTPFALPVTGSGGITTDDISSVVAFGGNKIGVMWSDQTRSTFHFAIHVDGTAAGTWTKEIALDGLGNADDHMNLKADSTGRVFAAVKTSQGDPNAALAYLLVRGSTGSWARHIFGRKRDHHTRPMVVLDETNRVAHMFATSGEEGGTIYHKKVEMNNIVFADGLGTPVLRDAASADMNDVTSTKQNLTTAAGSLVFQGSDDTTRFYWHNSVPLTPLPLDADFVGTPTTGAAPLAVAFTDQSRGAPTSWLWEFGDGTTSTEQSPSHTYSAPGTYTVRLTARTASGATDQETRTSYITAQPLAAEFTGTPTNGAAPLAVTFTDASTGSPIAWSWDFGDGSTSTTRNPSHTYATAGTYTVRLTVTGAGGGTNTKTRVDYVTALPLTAEFTGSPTSGPAPHTTTFTDTSIGTPTSWSWHFGDGGTSTLRNPSHTYSTPGTYTVSLTVTDASGAVSTRTRTGYVTALPLTADFSASPTFGTAPLAVTFTDTSIGTPTTWAWNFGDGQTSSLESPTHTYTDAGLYTVTLTVTDAAGATSTKTRTDYVTASPDAIVTPVADSYVNSTAPDRNFGIAGSVRVRNGDTAPPHYVSYLKFDVAGLTANVTAAKLRLHITDAASDGGAVYAVANTWTEGGLVWTNAPAISGTPLATIPGGAVGAVVEVSLPASAFAAGNGTYSLALKSNNPSGGAIWYSSREGVAAPQLVLRTIALPLDADFAATPTRGGAPLAVAFSDVSRGEPTSWLWDFGDGTTSTEQNPSHTYTELGSYTVSLTVTDARGDLSTETRADVVVVEPLAAAFAASPTSGPTPITVNFTDSSTGSPVSWAWDFGDGGTSTAQNPSHVYTEPGTYTVSLTVVDANGATSTHTREGYVSALQLTADFAASPTFGTAPLFVSFTDKTIGTPTTWTWDFGDGTTSAAQNPTHTYANVGTYTVTLTVTDADGDTSTKTRTNLVTASGSPVFSAGADSFISSNEPTRNFGTSGSVRVRSGATSPPHYTAFLKFAVSGLGSAPTTVTLRLYVTDAANEGGSVYVVDNNWTESTLTWNNAPVVSGVPLATIPAAAVGTWVDVTLPASAFAAGNGTYSLAIKSNNPNAGAVWYSSREGTSAAQLVASVG